MSQGKSIRVSLLVIIVCALIILGAGIFVIPTAKHPCWIGVIVLGACGLIVLEDVKRSRRGKAESGLQRQVKRPQNGEKAAESGRPGNRRLKWFAWDAHVDIILPESLAAAWGGSNPPSNGRGMTVAERVSHSKEVATDYDRACDVSASLAPLPVGGGTGLVISEAPLITWVPQGEEGCLVVALAWGGEDDMDAMAMRAVSDAALGVSGEPQFVFHNPGRRLFLFAAADTFGSEYGYGHLEIGLPPGDYQISTADYGKEGVNRFLVHRLQKIKT
jgi:hypothetical protein